MSCILRRFHFSVLFSSASAMLNPISFCISSTSVLSYSLFQLPSALVFVCIFITSFQDNPIVVIVVDSEQTFHGTGQV